jgi:hypothetical protein
MLYPSPYGGANKARSFGREFFLKLLAKKAFLRDIAINHGLMRDIRPLLLSVNTPVIGFVFCHPA